MGQCAVQEVGRVQVQGDAELIVRANLLFFRGRRTCRVHVSRTCGRVNSINSHFHELTARVRQKSTMLAGGAIVGEPQYRFGIGWEGNIQSKGLAGNELPRVKLDLRLGSAPVGAAPLGAEPCRRIHLGDLFEHGLIADDDDVEGYHTIRIRSRRNAPLEGESRGVSDGLLEGFSRMEERTAGHQRHGSQRQPSKGYF